MAFSDGLPQAMLARLDKIGDRQEVMIKAMDGQTDCLRMVSDQLAELLDWSKEPPSTDLADPLKEMAAALKSVEQTMADLPERVAALVVSRLRA